MIVLLILMSTVCLILGMLYLRLLADIHSLYGQLGEIERGSHMELAVGSRQKALLAFCRKLNQVLASKDANHVKYERAERQLKQNITNLAHDIRTPLTGASGYVQLAQECGEPAKRAHYLQTAARRLTELEDMLEKLFLYTKLTNEEFTFPPDSPKRIQVLPLLGDCLLSLYTSFEEKGISPEVAFESESFCVTADEDALRRVFLNLIQNALLHGSGGISITQREDSSSVGCLIFENPVPEDSSINVSQMFDRFYKASAARGKGSSGLGLFIVKELMRRMNGDVRAELEDSVLRIILRFPE